MAQQHSKTKTAPDGEKLRYCSRCQEWKPDASFYNRGIKSPYKAAYCKQCHTRSFENESIRCPHCAKKVFFVGVDEKGEVIRRKNSLIKKLKKEAIEQYKNKKRKKKAAKTLDTKEIFK